MVRTSFLLTIVLSLGSGSVAFAQFRNPTHEITPANVGDASTSIAARDACLASSSIAQETLLNQESGVEELNTKNRFLSFSVGDPGMRQAIRVIVNSVTEAHHQHLVGSEWWVQPRRGVGGVSGVPEPVAGFSTYWGSNLGCTPSFGDWYGACDNGQCEGGLRGSACQPGGCAGGPNNGLTCSDDLDCPGETCNTTADCGTGTLHVYGEAVVPGARYTIQVAHEDCDLGIEASFSNPVGVDTTLFGDVVGSCAQSPCSAADNRVAIIDVFAALSRFLNAPGAPSKTRADFEPSTLDLEVNITDILFQIQGFLGIPFPYLRCDPAIGKCRGGPNNEAACTLDSECELELCAPIAARGG